MTNVKETTAVTWSNYCTDLKAGKRRQMPEPVGGFILSLIQFYHNWTRSAFVLLGFISFTALQRLRKLIETTF